MMNFCPKCYVPIKKNLCPHCKTSISIQDGLEVATVYIKKDNIVVKIPENNKITHQEVTELHNQIYESANTLVVPIDTLTVAKNHLSSKRIVEILSSSTPMPNKDRIFYLPYNMYGEMIHALLWLCAGRKVKICVPKEHYANKQARELMNFLYQDLQEIFPYDDNLTPQYNPKPSDKVKRANAHMGSLRPRKFGQESLDTFRSKVDAFIKVAPKNFKNFSYDYVTYAKDKGVTVKVESEKIVKLEDDNGFMPTYAFWLRYFQDTKSSISPKNMNFDVFLHSVQCIVETLSFSEQSHEIRLLFFGDSEWLTELFYKDENEKFFLKEIYNTAQLYHPKKALKLHIIDFTGMYRDKDYLAKSVRFFSPRFNINKPANLDQFLTWHEQISAYRGVLQYYQPQCVIGSEAGSLDMLGVVMGVPIVSIEMNKEKPGQVIQSYFHDRLGQCSLFQPKQWTLINYGLHSYSQQDPRYKEHHALFVKYLRRTVYVLTGKGFKINEDDFITAGW